MCYCASIQLSYDTGIRLLLFSCVTVCRCSWTCRRYGTVSWWRWRKSLQADSVSYTVRNMQRGKQLHTRNWQLCSSQPDHSSFTILLQWSVHCRLQWSSGNMPNCSVRGSRFRSHLGQSVYHNSHSDIQPWAETLLQCLGQVSVPPFGER